MKSEHASTVAERLTQAINGLEDGVHVLSLKDGEILPVPNPSPVPPILTASGDEEQLYRLVDCFQGWEGQVKIAALQDEGLLDVWVY